MKFIKILLYCFYIGIHFNVRKISDFNSPLLNAPYRYFGLGFLQHFKLFFASYLNFLLHGTELFNVSNLGFLARYLFYGSSKENIPLLLGFSKVLFIFFLIFSAFFLDHVNCMAWTMLNVKKKKKKKREREKNKHESPVFQINSRATKLYKIYHCMTNYIYALGNVSSLTLKVYTFHFSTIILLLKNK